MSNKISVGIVGGSGFTAGELIRILANHPEVEIKWIYSRSKTGILVSETHEDMAGWLDIMFTDQLDWDVDAVFLCLPHETARNFVESHNIPESTSIIDLSRDYRLQPQKDGFVYGLPELHREAVRKTRKLANPGCFATAIQLAVLPLAHDGLIKSDLHITGITGSTGAGKSLSATTHFTWRSSNASVYKVLKHQHVDEIRNSVQFLQTNFQGRINFVPMRGNFTRGILASVYTETAMTQDDAITVFQKYYADHPFVHVSSSPVDMKQVVGTNMCRLSVTLVDGLLHITSVIDNLVKGASGQAVQNFNLMFGLPEDTGLRLKSIAY